MVNTKEYLVLSELAYFDISDSEKQVKKAISDLDYATKFKDESGNDIKVTGHTKAEFDKIYINNINEMSNWKVIAHKNSNDDSGFCGTAFKNEITGEIVFSFRGTEPESKKNSLLPEDIITDGQLALVENVMGVSKQFGDAYDFVKDTMEQVSGETITENSKLINILANNNVTFTGHSLGGGLAQYMTYKTGIEATRFNAVGIGQALSEELDFSGLGYAEGRLAS